MAKDFSFEDISGGGAAPIAAPPRDFLTSLIQFIDRAISLTHEINGLITTAKTELAPLIAEKVAQKITPSDQPAMPAALTDPEEMYKQLLDGLNQLKAMVGDIPLSQVIERMKQNKGVVIAGLQAKIQAAKAGADIGLKK
ncbi:MAG: hypothetical protein HWN68_13915 [Desulfobacterales bacterium]|nr:hypothetical protein [Desulfobacterales bacterium]